MVYKSYKGFFRPKNIGKYKGDFDNIVFRSLLERRVMGFLDENPNVVEWSSEETIIPYISPLDGRYHRYFPDFWAKMIDRSGVTKTVLIEVKPSSQTREPKRKSKEAIKTWLINEAKWKAATEYCKEKSWAFQILTEEDISPKKK